MTRRSCLTELKIFPLDALSILTQFLGQDGAFPARVERRFASPSRPGSLGAVVATATSTNAVTPNTIHDAREQHPRNDKKGKPEDQHLVQNARSTVFATSGGC